MNENQRWTSASDFDSVQAASTRLLSSDGGIFRLIFLADTLYNYVGPKTKKG
jgi:hypothetical protein